jgi:hypothetical protein
MKSSDFDAEYTQKYSTFGDKLLQHTDVLYSIQNFRVFKPITIQVAPNEFCDSDCPFCSVADRPLKSYMPWNKLQKLLSDFKYLGAKSLELSGGGNPLLYRDKEFKKDINDVIDFAYKLGYEIGIITNSSSFQRLRQDVFDKIKWIRVSLIQLDEGVEPEQYDFCSFPYSKLGFSYIIYDTGGVADELSRTKKIYTGTSADTIKRIARLVELHSNIKFVRIAGNCLIKGNNAAIRDKYKSILDEIDQHHKIFIKDIGYDDGPFDSGCYVGLIRPYIAPHPSGGDYQIYICTSHVLNHRTYDLQYSLGSIDNVIEIWDNANKHHQQFGYPYEIKCNSGKDWENTCKYCYYKHNNKLLHTVINEMPDKNFP